MRGCRPLSPIETRTIAKQLAQAPRELRIRNIALWLTLHVTGLRISEALALKVEDVWTGPAVRSHVALRRSRTKGAKSGGTFPLHPKARRVLTVYLKFHRPGVGPKDPLFPSERDAKTALTRNGAWRFLRKAIVAAGVHGQTGWHSTRKTFCQAVYGALEFDLEATRAAMRHSSILTTAVYLQADRGRVEAAIIGI